MALPLNSLNQKSPVLLTDLYELTMAYGYWKTGMADTEAAFTMSFRKNPFNGGFAIFCGLSYLREYLADLRFSQEDIDYLEQIKDRSGKQLLSSDFLQYLKNLRFNIDVHAVRDGSVVFAHEPIVRVVGPIIPAQIVETALLNLIGFPSLIATKAARVKLAAGDQPVYEFGLRRAQGMDGGLSASLASYVGGCDGTSNTLAGKIFDIPVVGTHAHSWVMSHVDETEAFLGLADVMPDNCILLVDTFDTIDGVKHAIVAGNRLKERGHHLLGIRLDSGDLAYLSVQARKMLDEAGFADTMIVASNDLDEYIITSLKDQGAKINAWAVGTKLVTASDNPALGAVYKLSAVRKPGKKNWRYCLKLSEQVAKISTPGLLQLRRFMKEDDHAGTRLFAADMVYDEALGNPTENLIVDPMDFTRRKKFPASTYFEDLLVPVVKNGELVGDHPGLAATRDYVQSQLKSLHPSIKRMMNPHQYPVGLEMRLHQLKTDLILDARGHKEEVVSER
ncbi:MAG: nicotinate phosphoribosyltransferase [Cyanobacteria bacterium]|nr:nicotinate phosphoribosyltransferase [Cyanobacteriota bacterium]